MDFQACDSVSRGSSSVMRVEKQLTDNPLLSAGIFFLVQLFDIGWRNSLHSNIESLFCFWGRDDQAG